MTYTLIGKLLREEKPSKYLNKFIDFQLIREIRAGYIHTERKCIITSSQRFANWLNKRGHNLEFNEDPELASRMCQRGEVEFVKTKVFSPMGSWENYLTRKFGETDEEITLDGEIQLWNETRVPTPWLYGYASGNLENVYVMSMHDGFIIEPNATHEGKRITKGILLDTPILNMQVSQTNTRTRTSRVTRRY